MKKLAIGILIILLQTTNVSALSDAQLLLTQPANDASLKITQQGTTSNSTSIGGAFNLNNTANSGAGMVLYTNYGDGALGHLATFRVDNALFPQSAIYTTSKGMSHTINSLYTGTALNTAAGSFNSTNPNFTAFQVTGSEYAHGTIKVSHNKPAGAAGNDANAAAVSVDLKGTDTAAQGYYCTSTASTGTTGACANFTNKINVGGTWTLQNIFNVGPQGFTTSKTGFRILDQDGKLQMKGRDNGVEYELYIENDTLKVERL